MIDIDLIKKQVKEVIQYSQNIENPKVNYLIDSWYEAKKDFIELFNNNLIYSTEEKITVDLSEDQKCDKIENFCNQMLNTFPQYDKLIKFIKDNQKDFFNNILSKSYKPTGYPVIPAGIKMSKAFKIFVHNEDDLYFIQTAASRVIQESKITGYLCLSVHPLDYLSSSENNYNWRSCHALNGEYRSGNLSYMLDKSTIICYLSSGKDTILPRFPDSVPWNNKKWRMLLFVSDNRNALFAGRHYPFFSKAIMEEIRLKWAEVNSMQYEHWLISRRHPEDNWSHWHDDNFKKIEYQEWGIRDNFSLNNRYIPIRDTICSMTDLITDVDCPLHFNDLLLSSCYIPYYCWFFWNSQSIHFSIGAKVKCLKCEDGYLWDHESMVCQDCLEDSGYIHCGDCGEIINIQDAIYIDNEDRYICQSCFDDYYFECPSCGEVFHQDDGLYDEDRDLTFCRACYNEMHNL